MTTTLRPSILRLLAFAGLLGAACVAAADVPRVSQPEIRREGTGARRDDLNALELKPLAASSWASLKGWTNGPAPTAESLTGKVVLIVTWAAWHPPSVGAVTRADRLLATSADKGLVVIAVHDAKRFEMATKLVQDRGLKLLVAQDEGGAFRQAIRADLDPNFYLIDRAGNLRFTDIESGMLEQATDLLVSEKAEDAAKVPAAFAAAVRAAKGPAVRTKAVAAVATEGEFKPPLPNLYELAKWPPRGGTETQPVPGNDMQGQRVPDADTFGQANTWLTAKPKLAGRVVVLFFGNTDNAKVVRARPGLVALADRYPLDLVVVAVAPNDTDTVATQRAFRENPPGYSVMQDSATGIALAIGSRGDEPAAAIVSTDGTIRWQGLTSDAAFRAAVEQTLAADPGVAARRAAQGR
ncbi:MAG: redoxin family protein [Phycisphaerales bacterium]